MSRENGGPERGAPEKGMPETGAPEQGAPGGGGPPRVLVVGMGNLLHEDDGFGPRVVEALGAGEVPPNVTLLDAGIGGIHLVQELMIGYDVLILVDAVDRDGDPGTIYVLEPTVPGPEAFEGEGRDGFFADTHYAVPAKALVLARALGVLPERVYILGCQPVRTELGLAMSGTVSRAVKEGVAGVHRLLETVCV